MDARLHLDGFRSRIGQNPFFESRGCAATIWCRRCSVPGAVPRARSFPAGIPFYERGR